MHYSSSAFRAKNGDMAECPAILLAGGHGSRLHELTANDSKPAVRFANHGRLADFALGNAYNSGLRNILVATQYRPETLHRRLNEFWKPIFERRGGTLEVRYGPFVTNAKEGYVGTAAAVSENIARIDALAPENVLILAADHVYRMNYVDMLNTHQATGADLTIAAAAVPCSEASGFGIIDADGKSRIVDFLEKPADPPGMRDDPANALASMGVYIFRWTALRDALMNDRADPASTHDFGFDIVPGFVAAGNSAVHRLTSPVSDIGAYWRDVGTLDTYRAAHLDLLHRRDDLLVAAREWPILPAAPGRVDRSLHTAMAGELELRDATRSFIASHTLIGNGAQIHGSVLMQGVVVGSGSRLVNCIVASGTVIDPGTAIGEDPVDDARWFRRTDGGTILVTPQMLSRRRRRSEPAELIDAMTPADRRAGAQQRW